MTTPNRPPTRRLPMPLRSKQRLVLVKTEGGTYGTDPSPTGSNALYILEPKDLSHHAPAAEPLSPAAQAVLDGYERHGLAGALRAAAEHVRTDRNLKRHYAATMAEMLVLDKLLAIAAELGGHHE